MNSRFPLVQMSQLLRLRKEFFTIDDAALYQLVTVQLHARGIRERQQLTGEEIKTKRQQRIQAGDLLVAEIDAKVGGFGVVPAGLAGAIVSSHYFLYEIDTNQADFHYLEYYLKSGQPEQDVQQFVKGSVNYAAIRPHHFPQLHIPFPSLDEQRRIVVRIEALAGRIAETQGLQDRALSESEAMIGGASFQLFGDLASSHPSRPIGDTFSFRSDLIHPGDGSRGQVRFIGLQHIEPHTGRRIGEDLVQAEELAGRKFKFSPGEIVYGYLRPYLNKVWVADCEGLCSVDQYVLKPKTDIVGTDYLAHFMRSRVFVDQAIERTHSLILPRLHSGLLASIAIPIPPLAEQRQAVRYLDSLRACVDAVRRLQETTQAELAALLPAVLDKAFRGEL